MPTTKSEDMTHADRDHTTKPPHIPDHLGRPCPWIRVDQGAAMPTIGFVEWLPTH